jgi:hypothetical protein
MFDWLSLVAGMLADKKLLFHVPSPSSQLPIGRAGTAQLPPCVEINAWKGIISRGLGSGYAEIPAQTRQIHEQMLKRTYFGRTAACPALLSQSLKWHIIKE